MAAQIGDGARRDGVVAGVDDRGLERPAVQRAQEDGAGRRAVVEDRRFVLAAEDLRSLAARDDEAVGGQIHAEVERARGGRAEAERRHGERREGHGGERGGGGRRERREQRAPSRARASRGRRARRRRAAPDSRWTR